MGKKRWHRETQEDREALWPLSAHERYISVDVETDGPVPGLHSMLSLGAAAYNAWGQRIGRFSANLETLPDADTDDRTMAWWAGQPEAWNRARERARDPKTVMEEFHVFALGEGRHTGRPVMVAYPAAFDAMWVTWYLLRFTSGDPFPPALHRLEDPRDAAARRRVRSRGETQHARELVPRKAP